MRELDYIESKVSVFYITDENKHILHDKITGEIHKLVDYFFEENKIDELEKIDRCMPDVCPNLFAIRMQRMGNILNDNTNVRIDLIPYKETEVIDAN